MQRKNRIGLALTRYRRMKMIKKKHKNWEEENARISQWVNDFCCQKCIPKVSQYSVCMYTLNTTASVCSIRYYSSMMQYELAIACIPKVASFNRIIARHICIWYWRWTALTMIENKYYLKPRLRAFLWRKASNETNNNVKRWKEIHFVLCAKISVYCLLLGSCVTLFQI